MSRVQVHFDAPEQLDCLVPPGVDVGLRFELTEKDGIPIDISRETLYLKLYMGNEPGSKAMEPIVNAPSEHEDGQNGATCFCLSWLFIDQARKAGGDPDGNSIPYRLYGEERIYLEGIIRMAVSVRHADLPRLSCTTAY
jgi:hypothetical protein